MLIAMKAAKRKLWKLLNGAGQLLETQADEIAALIVEPIVQGASGIIVMPAGCLQEMAALCRKHGVLFIADEVATGFGPDGRYVCL